MFGKVCENTQTVKSVSTVVYYSRTLVHFFPFICVCLCACVGVGVCTWSCVRAKDMKRMFTTGDERTQESVIQNCDCVYDCVS